MVPKLGALLCKELPRRSTVRVAREVGRAEGPLSVYLCATMKNRCRSRRADRLGRGEPFEHTNGPVTVERLVLKVLRSVASQGNEWQVSAAAVIAPPNLTGRNQSDAAGRLAASEVSRGPAV